MSAIESVIRAVLYEGYMLYPYRPSSTKNRQRWTFGGVFPRSYAHASGSDPWSMQTECLVNGSEQARLSVRVGFLQIIERDVLGPNEDASGAGTGVLSMLDVDGKRFHPWQEAMERTVDVTSVSIGRLYDEPLEVPFAFEAATDLEELHDSSQRVRGALRRTRCALSGVIELLATQVEEGVGRVTARVLNMTDIDLKQSTTLSRDAASLHALVSCHVVLKVTNGEFVSATDPPAELAAQTTGCTNIGVWPVLVGETGSRDAMLASPIILYDYPQIAPESAGDLFDSTEIDEILTLRILTMTDDEKREMAESDARARALLERTERLGMEDMQRLHGQLRRVRDDVEEGDDASRAPWEALDARPQLACIRSSGIALRIGDRVRLRPRVRADIFDLALDGQIATIESIERDFEDRVHLAVTIDCDPGRDLGVARMPGHRFFFGPDEIEPLGSGEARS